MQHVDGPAIRRVFDKERMSIAVSAVVRPDTAKPYVYFIRMGEKGPIKIGFATNPYARLIDLQTSSPYKLRLLAVFEGGAAAEGRLLGFFAKERLEGEWFKPSKRLLRLVAAHGLPTEADILGGQWASWRRAAKCNHDLAALIRSARSEGYNAKPILCRQERWDTVYGPQLAEASSRTPKHFDAARDAVMAVLPPCRPVCRCNVKEKG